jgi:hypothetical protein
MSKKENFNSSQEQKKPNTSESVEKKSLFSKFSENVKNARDKLANFASERRISLPPKEIAKEAVSELKSLGQKVWSKFGNNKNGEPKETPISQNLNQKNNGVETNPQPESILTPAQLNGFKKYSFEELQKMIENTEELLEDEDQSMIEKSKKNVELRKLYKLSEQFTPSESDLEAYRSMGLLHEEQVEKIRSELLEDFDLLQTNEAKEESLQNLNTIIDQLKSNNSIAQAKLYDEITPKIVEDIPELKIFQIEEIDRNPSLLDNPILNKMYDEYKKNKAQGGLSQNAQEEFQRFNKTRVKVSNQKKLEDPSIIQLATIDGKINTISKTKLVRNPDTIPAKRGFAVSEEVRAAIKNMDGKKIGAKQSGGNYDRKDDLSWAAESSQPDGNVAVLERPTEIKNETDKGSISNSEDFSQYLTTTRSKATLTPKLTESQTESSKEESAIISPDEFQIPSESTKENKPFNWNQKVNFRDALSLLKRNIGTNGDGNRNFVGRLVDIGTTHVDQAKVNIISGAKEAFRSSQKIENNSGEITEERKESIIGWLIESGEGLSTNEMTQAENEKTEMINELSPTELTNLYKACEAYDNLPENKIDDNDKDKKLTQVKLVAKYLSGQNRNYFMYTK